MRRPSGVIGLHLQANHSVRVPTIHDRRPHPERSGSGLSVRARASTERRDRDQKQTKEDTHVVASRDGLFPRPTANRVSKPCLERRAILLQFVAFFPENRDKDVFREVVRIKRRAGVFLPGEDLLGIGLAAFELVRKGLVDVVDQPGESLSRRQSQMVNRQAGWSVGAFGLEMPCGGGEKDGVGWCVDGSVGGHVWASVSSTTCAPTIMTDSRPVLDTHLLLALNGSTYTLEKGGLCWHVDLAISMLLQI